MTPPRGAVPPPLALAADSTTPPAAAIAEAKSQSSSEQFMTKLSVATPDEKKALMEAAGGGEMTKESVSTTLSVLKQRENVRALSSYLRTEVPPLYTALIGERDEYMAQSLLGSSGERIVAVIGLAHVDGIEAAILKANGDKIASPKACRAV